MSKSLRITCSICGHYFNPAKIRRDGEPTGISLQMKDNTWIHVCHDCICDEQQYRKLLERVNGHEDEAEL